MSAKERAIEIYKQHIELASTDGRLFRQTVLNQLMKELGCSVSTAAAHYNNAKKLNPVAGLGRDPVAKGVRKMGGAKAKKEADLVPDNECFSVIEIVNPGTNPTVGRCQSFIMQGDASEKFDEKAEAWPNSTWVMIQGLGPNSGETYRLEPDEKEIKRYAPEMAA